MCMHVSLCVWVYVYRMCAGALRDQKRALNAPELEWHVSRSRSDSRTVVSTLSCWAISPAPAPSHTILFFLLKEPTGSKSFMKDTLFSPSNLQYKHISERKKSTLETLNCPYKTNRWLKNFKMVLLVYDWSILLILA